MSRNSKKIPAKFDSYNKLNKWLLNYQEANGNKFNVHNSESLYKVYKNRPAVDFNPYLIYDRIKYRCSTFEQKEKDLPETCPAKLWLSTSPHKKKLQVDDFNNEHNHPPAIVGKDGPIKQRQLLLENAIKLYEKFQAQKSGPVKPITESRRKSHYKLPISGHTSTNKYATMQPVVMLRRINDPADVEFIKFTSFLQSLRPRVDVESILNNKGFINLHNLLKIEKNNVFKIINFDLRKMEKYFIKSAYVALNILMNAKIKS